MMFSINLADLDQKI